VLFELKDPNQELLRLFADSQRWPGSADHLGQQGAGNSCILVLMPLTCDEGSLS